MSDLVRRVVGVAPSCRFARSRALTVADCAGGPAGSQRGRRRFPSLAFSQASAFRRTDSVVCPAGTRLTSSVIGGDVKLKPRPRNRCPVRENLDPPPPVVGQHGVHDALKKHAKQCRQNPTKANGGNQAGDRRFEDTRAAVARRTSDLSGVTFIPEVQIALGSGSSDS